MQGVQQAKELIALAEKLVALKQDNGTVNMADLHDFLQHDADKLLDAAHDNMWVLERLLEKDYPDQQRILDF